MTQESYEFTRDQVKNLGFGDDIAGPLLTKMEQNLTEFTLDHTRKFGNDEMRSTLYFSKGDQKDYTFFNKFDTTLMQEGKEDLTQTFFVGPKYNYTLQERYNMMDGRAAYREQPVMKPVAGDDGVAKMKPTGETYFAWRALDFKASDQYGNFNPKIMFWNHQKEVLKYPIKGIEENYDKERLLRRLEKGNKVDVTLLKDGQELSAKMTANPKMMRLDFYDSNGQSLIVRKVEKQAVDQTQKVEMTPQEVQRAAKAQAAEQKQDAGQGQNQQQAEKGSVKQNVAAEQQQEHGQKRRPGVRV
ncbi:MAG: hypothetical protein V4553_05725 [Bacteroidota bacterium]